MAWLVDNLRNTQEKINRQFSCTGCIILIYDNKRDFIIPMASTPGRATADVGAEMPINWHRYSG